MSLNISNFAPENDFWQGVLLHYFNLKKTSVEIRCILVDVYDEHALAERMSQKWFVQFKCGDFDSEDEKHLGQFKR